MGCGEDEIQSRWLDRQITPDRSQNAAQQLIAKDQVSVEVQNDDKSLSLRLSTRNRSLQRQISTAGLTVWLDETGGKKMTYSLRFPPLSPNGQQEPVQRDREEKSEYAGIIEIIGPGESEFSRMSIEDSLPYGIRYKTGIVGGDFVVEIQLPLIRNAATPYGVTSSKRNVIGIGLVSVQRELSRAGTGDGRGRGGGGGRRGGRGRGVGQASTGVTSDASERGGSRGAGQESLTPLSQWLKVHLANKP